MTEELKLRRVGVLSVFDEARAEIARWEREYPSALSIALIVSEPNSGFEYSVTGERTITEVAGIFYRAAQLVCE